MLQRFHLEVHSQRNKLKENCYLKDTMCPYTSVHAIFVGRRWKTCSTDFTPKALRRVSVYVLMTDSSSPSITFVLSPSSSRPEMVISLDSCSSSTTCNGKTLTTCQGKKDIVRVMILIVRNGNGNLE